MASPYDSINGQLKADTKILDAYGRPIIPELLERELAFPTLTGIRTIWQDVVTPGLDPVSLAGMLQDAAQGNHYAFLCLAEEMEEKDLHYAAQLGTRKRAVVRLPIDIDAAKTVKGKDEKGKPKWESSDRDEEIAEAVREMVDSDHFRGLLEDLLDALGKGYSVSEICWDQTGNIWTPEQFKWRDPKFFQFDIVTRARIRLRDLKDAAFGIPLAPYKFIVHYPRLKTGIPLRGGLARLVAWSYLFKNFTIKDWIAFIEIFGMPLRMGRYDANVVTDKDLQVLKAAVRNIGSDAAAILPKSMEIEFQEAAKATGGEKLFEGAATYLDKQISKAILGQTMTADDGSSQSQAKVHDEVRGDIRDADALQLAATINRDLIRPFVDLNFGPQAKYPRFKFITAEPDDLESKAKRDGELSRNAGVRLTQAYFEREYGFQPGDIAGVGVPATETDTAGAAAGIKTPNTKDNKALNRQQGVDVVDLPETRLADQTGTKADPAITALVNRLRSMTESAEQMEELAANVVNAFPGMSTESLAGILAEQMVRASMAGRMDVENGE